MRSRQVACLVALTLAGAACHKMTTLTLDEVERLRPASIWVTNPDQSIVEVGGPQVFNDTIVGYVNGEFSELPAAGLKKMVMKQPARGKTIALFAAGTLVAGGVIWMIAGPNKFNDPKFSAGDCDDDPDLPGCQ
jgi:hypothetical protein